MVISSAEWRSEQRTRPPSGTNLKALPSRFMTTRCSLSGSIAATQGPAASTAYSIRRSAANTAKCEARKRTSAATSVSCRSIFSLRASIFDMSRRSLTCLSNIRALRATTSPRLAPLRQAHRPGVVDQPLRRAEDERQRRAQLVADVGEKLRLDVVELADALEQPLQLDVLLGDLPLLRFLRGDVAPLGTDEHHLACVVGDRHQRGVDDDRDRAIGAGIEGCVPADELPLRGAGDGVPDSLVGFFGDLPPESRPERLAFDIGELHADRVERHFVDLDDRALGIEQTDELHHRVERDAGDLLAVLLAGVGRNDLGSVNDEGWRGRIARHVWVNSRLFLACRRPRAQSRIPRVRADQPLAAASPTVGLTWARRSGCW